MANEVKGYLVVFTIQTNGSAFFNNLDDAIYTRNIIAGGGLIYHATIEKSGSNCFPVRGEIVRTSEGTPI